MMLKVARFTFDDESKEAFEDLKGAVVNSAVFSMYNPDSDIEVYTDASAIAISGSLMQKRPGDNASHPVPLECRIASMYIFTENRSLQRQRSKDQT